MRAEADNGGFAAEIGICSVEPRELRKGVAHIAQAKSKPLRMRESEAIRLRGEAV